MTTFLVVYEHNYEVLDDPTVPWFGVFGTAHEAQEEIDEWLKLSLSGWLVENNDDGYTLSRGDRTLVLEINPRFTLLSDLEHRWPDQIRTDWVVGHKDLETGATYCSVWNMAWNWGVVGTAVDLIWRWSDEGLQNQTCTDCAKNILDVWSSCKGSILNPNK